MEEGRRRFTGMKENNRIEISVPENAQVVLDSLQNMADKDAAKYNAWWRELGMVLKEGFYMNWEHLDELKKLLRFESTKTVGDALVGLDEYVKRMPEARTNPR